MLLLQERKNECLMAVGAQLDACFKKAEISFSKGEGECETLKSFKSIILDSIKKQYFTTNDYASKRAVRDPDRAGVPLLRRRPSSSNLGELASSTISEETETELQPSTTSIIASSLACFEQRSLTCSDRSANENIVAQDLASLTIGGAVTNATMPACSDAPALLLSRPSLSRRRSFAMICSGTDFCIKIPEARLGLTEIDPAKLADLVCAIEKILQPYRDSTAEEDLCNPYAYASPEFKI